MFTTLYQTILYIPLFNLLVFFYNMVPGHDLGLAIILLTLATRIILSPFFVQSIKAQRAMQAIQPKLDALKEKYKDSKEKLGPAIMALYKQEKVSPFSSCLPLLIQLPFLIAVYQVFISGLTKNSFDKLYSFVANPGSLNPLAFGFLDLSEKSVVIAVLAGLAQFWQSKSMMSQKSNKLGQLTSSNPMANAMTKQMTYFMPVLTVFIGATLPAGLTFYWFLTTLFSALQQVLLFKKLDKTDSPS